MWAVRVGTRSRFGHARLCVAVDGAAITVVEAKPSGAVERTLGVREAANTTWVTTDPTDTERTRIVAGGRTLIGIGYGWLDIVVLAIRCLLGVRWRWVDAIVNRLDRLICSQLVALAYHLAGITLVPGNLPCEDTPGDLAPHPEGNRTMTWFDRLPAPLRHTLLMLSATAIGAGIDWLSKNQGSITTHVGPAWSGIVGTAITLLIAYITPLTRQYGVGANTGNTVTTDADGNVIGNTGISS